MAFSKFQTPFCSFLLFAYYSFKLVSNSSFKLAVKGELHLEPLWVLAFKFRAQEMQYPLNSEF